MTDFKNLGVINFENIKLRGMYEWKLFPTELIINTIFTLTPTDQAISDFQKPEDFHQFLNRKFGTTAINRICHQQLTCENWKFDGVRYTYEHSITAIRLKKSSSTFGVDFYFVAQTKLNATEIKEFFQTVSSQIAKLSLFQSSDYFEVKPNRKDAKNME